GGDGARHRRRRQRAGRHHQRVPRRRADAVHGRSQSDHGGRDARRSQPSHPLGAGILRPGRARTRVREVGLRAAKLRPARDRGRPRARDRRRRAAGSGLPDAAARGAVRSAGVIRVFTHVARAAAPAATAEAATLLAAARRPLTLAKAAGRDPAAVASLVALAEALGAPVVDQFHTHMNFPQDHELHGGFDGTPYLADADVIVVVESDVPWFPSLKTPRPDAKLIQIAVDPLFTRYPIRGSGGDGALPGPPRLTLAALAEAVSKHVDAHGVAERRAKLAAGGRERRASIESRARALRNDTPIDMAWLSRCVGDVLDDRTIVVNEYDLDA